MPRYRLRPSEFAFLTGAERAERSHHLAQSATQHATDRARMLQRLAHGVSDDALELLVEEFAASSCFNADPYVTAYLNGQRDLVQLIIEAKKEVDDGG